MENRLQNVEKEIEEIKARNMRVEADKAWETSWFRTITLTAITYIVGAIVLFLIGVKEYWLGAFVPAAGFFLSVQSLPLVKSWWLRRRRTSRKA